MSEMNNTLPEIIPGDRHPDYKGEIAALLRGNLAPGQLRKKLEDYHERDIAEALELLRRDEDLSRPEHRPLLERVRELFHDTADSMN